MFKTLRYSIMLKTVPLLIIISCGGDQRIETVFNEELENIKSRYTPDKALDVFSINLKRTIQNGYFLEKQQMKMLSLVLMRLQIHYLVKLTS